MFVIALWGAFDRTVGRRTMHMDVQVSREGRMPEATAAVELAGMPMFAYPGEGYRQCYFDSHFYRYQ